MCVHPKESNPPPPPPPPPAAAEPAAAEPDPEMPPHEPPQQQPQPPQPPPPLPQPASPDEVAAFPEDDEMFASLSPLTVSPPRVSDPGPTPPYPLPPSPPSSSFPTVDDWLNKCDESSDVSNRSFPSPPREDDFDVGHRNQTLSTVHDYYNDLIEVAKATAAATTAATDSDDGAPKSPSAKLVGAGIENLGSTCFMSSILQCLTHTISLLQGLRSYTHHCVNDAGEFCVFCALLSHTNSCFSPSRSVVYPIFLVQHLNHISEGFQLNKQEDAHEFMQSILNKLKSCFPPPEHLNLVEEVFGGVLVSQLRCTSCGHCSDTFEPSIDMSLGIENMDTLLDALASFTNVENIDEKVTCNSCKENVSMEKRFLLTQTPSVAAFHLKRFTGEGIYVRKIEGHVLFPLELDLQPYMFGAENDNVELNYDLYAVVVHTGRFSNSGHYFCFVRSSPDKWHKLDDKKVTSVSGDDVLSQPAYILFYARQGTPWFSSIMEDENSCPPSGSGNKGDCGGDEQMEDENPYPPSGSGNKGDCGVDEQIEDEQHSDPNSVLGNRGDSGSDGEVVDAYDECVSALRDDESGQNCDTTDNQVPLD